MSEASSGVGPEPTHMSGPTPATDEQIRASFVGELTPYAVKVVVEDYDPEWPAWYRDEEARIRSALGDRVIRIEHTGSTSVPGLAAKPIIDITLLVGDSSDEDSYVPDLEALGYELRVGEPDWYEHRCLATRVETGAARSVNLHVFAPGIGDPEVARTLLFRDWLRANDDDRALYDRTKRELATQDWKFVQNYADAKTEVIEQILARARAQPVR